jgi:hypothetical protein
MVLALDGDSTMTSLVPRPSPVTAAPLLALAPPALAGVLVPLAVVAAFVFVASILAGTLFPSSHLRRGRPHGTRGHTPPHSCNHRAGSVCSLGPAGIHGRFHYRRLNHR